MIPDDVFALRPREAARALSISVRHLWQLTRDGIVPCVKLGSGKRKTVLYPTHMLRTWLAEQSLRTGLGQPADPDEDLPIPSVPIGGQGVDGVRAGA
jgi:hypothetical protein